MKDISTRDVVEYVVYNNIENIKSKKVIYTSMLLTLLLEYFLFAKFGMIFSSIELVDYLINVLIFIMIYGGIASILMHLHIMKIEKFIILNIDILLKDVDLESLQEAYESSLSNNIKDIDLLEYLQNYKRK